MSAVTVARALRNQAIVSGLAQRRLPAQGNRAAMVITLRLDGDDWVVSFTRHAATVTDSELITWRAAFGIPSGAEMERESVNGYEVRRLRWAAVAQGELF